ncbi:hypothetical protein Vretimale_3107 [Volvox reticuliferus]|uniref:Uncharacterized protein n=1 Tax=Volvox reticuliferus TaxID=1737510 RepID=A0A8J4D814_9CHLO|nr:hypothetical protein Vretifemale_6707 [Volvox reticuliferus]GIL97462.1 hypothetical protein Vretimale_3107 [Volvox reticuliferus]
MRSWPVCKRLARTNMKVVTHINASGTRSEPPVETQLDLVLKRASRKVKLVHPASQTPHDERQKVPVKQPAASPVASRTMPRKRLQTQPLDDDALFANITESKRDGVWENIKLAVDEEFLKGPGDYVLPQQRRRAVPSAHDNGPSTSSRHALTTAEHVSSSSSSFKGFGTPPRQGEPGPRAPAPVASRSSLRHTPTAPTAAVVMPQSSPQPKEAGILQGGQAGDQGSPLRLFLFNAEAARTRVLLQQLGLAARVQVVDDLRCANAVVAAKLPRSGKHVNLTQGERTAANLGIPFLVVGRNMTAENLKVALLPLLDPQSEDAAGMLQKQSSRRGPTPVELQAHRLEVMHGFAQMLREGAPTPAPAAGAQGTEDS